MKIIVSQTGIRHILKNQFEGICGANCDGETQAIQFKGDISQIDCKRCLKIYNK